MYEAKVEFLEQWWIQIQILPWGMGEWILMEQHICNDKSSTITWLYNAEMCSCHDSQLLVLYRVWFHSFYCFFVGELEKAKTEYAKVKEELDSTMQELNEMWKPN